MRSQAKPSPRLEPQGEYALRLTRIKAGTTVTLRCLSKSIDGLFAHYVGRPQRSQYCPGAGECRHHRDRIQWRGYLAAEQWDQATGLYFPTVVEITEYAEVEMRGRYQRGQIWTLSRQLDVDDVPQPVVPVLVRDSANDNLQPAFNVLPVLINIYHAFNVALGVSNPMPARVLVRPVAGEPPPGASRPEANGKPISADDLAELRKRIAGMTKEAPQK